MTRKLDNSMAFFAHLSRLWRTVRYLKIIQVYNRLYRKIYRPPLVAKAAPALRNQVQPASAFIPRSECLSSSGVFTFLNIHGSVIGEEWNASCYPKLWLYNLHYFDWLLQAGGITSDKRTATIEKWVAENPIGTGNGWEPYPLSLRIVNWIKWHDAGQALSAPLLNSLGDQIRFLSRCVEYHLLGNHVLANGKALYLAGLFFTGTEAEAWRDLGMRILEKQLPEQILADGGHFELSPVYHCTILEDLLDIINFGRAYGQPTVERWVPIAQRMLQWLFIMTRPDGKVPLFNDGAYGVAPDTQALQAYAYRLGIVEEQNIREMHVLKDSGYFRYSTENYVLFGDIGQIGPEYIPGHAHADMFNFELCVGDHAVIVDTGTSTYETSDRRLLERGTAAHNTVQLGDYNQSEVWGAFRVGRRARIKNIEISEQHVAGTHNGYERFGLQTSRVFKFSRDAISIRDELKGNTAPFPAYCRFHFSPDVRVSIEGKIVYAGNLVLKFENDIDVALFDYLYSPEFHKRIPAKELCVTFKGYLETTISIS